MPEDASSAAPFSTANPAAAFAESRFVDQGSTLWKDHEAELFLLWIFVAVQPPANDTERLGVGLLMIFISVPLLAGLWLARRGDPDIGQRFLSGLGLRLVRLSWLTGAVVSFGVGMALFLTLMLTAGMLRHLGDDQYNFLYLLLLYVPVMALSAIARLVDHLGRSD